MRAFETVFSGQSSGFTKAYESLSNPTSKVAFFVCTKVQSIPTDVSWLQLDVLGRHTTAYRRLRLSHLFEPTPPLQRWLHLHPRALDLPADSDLELRSDRIVIDPSTDGSGAEVYPPVLAADMVEDERDVEVGVDGRGAVEWERRAR